DLRRGANLEVVLAWWWAHGFTPVVQSDGLDDDAPFDRDRAFTFAKKRFPETSVLVFADADVLVHPLQVSEAVREATQRTGPVVPYTSFRYLSDDMTAEVRKAHADWATTDLGE